MFRQLVVNGLIYGLGFYATLIAELDSISHAAFKVILTGYGFWNLYYFHHLISPFCVSQLQGVKNFMISQTA